MSETNPDVTLATLDAREQHLATQRVLHSLVESHHRLAESHQRLTEEQRLLAAEQRGLSRDIKALIARLDAIIRGRNNGEPTA